MSQKPALLICDDDDLYRMSVRQVLSGAYDVTTVANTDEALSLLSKKRFDVLLMDIQMRTPDEGLKAIPKVREKQTDLSIIMCSGLTDYGAVREAMRLGATDYLVKDFERDDLSLVVQRVLEKRSLVFRNEQQRNEVWSVQKKHPMIGESKLIQTLRKTLEKIRNSPANVVITGETGTGKEVVARQLRKALPDGSLSPFVAVDSSTIQSTMAESILFGYEKGAFTGADRQKKGIFEDAQGGIVYFDEISNMPLDIQAKLLRVIQEKEVLRLGGTQPISLDFRVVCATNKDLEKLSAQGQFKDDLLQRLNVIPIQLTPLRERREDIPELIAHFLKKHAPNAQPFSFSDEAMKVVQNYAWPGNIRELENLISYLITLVEGPEIDVSDLPPKFRDASQKNFTRTTTTSTSADTGQTFYNRVASFEKQLLQEEYEHLKGNVSKLALSLGMDRSHLYSKLKEYGIHPKA